MRSDADAESDGAEIEARLEEMQATMEQLREDLAVIVAHGEIPAEEHEDVQEALDEFEAGYQKAIEGAAQAKERVGLIPELAEVFWQRFGLPTLERQLDQVAADAAEMRAAVEDVSEDEMSGEQLNSVDRLERR